MAESDPKEPVYDPKLVAEATLSALGSLIQRCTPEDQPSPEVLKHFLELYREIRGAPEGMAKLLSDILAAQEHTKRALTALTGQAIGAPVKGRSWTQ